MVVGLVVPSEVDEEEAEVEAEEEEVVAEDVLVGRELEAEVLAGGRRRWSRGKWWQERRRRGRG